MMQKFGWLGIALVLAWTAGCASHDAQEFGQCEAPDGHLQVMYKSKNPLFTFSNPFCVVCNNAIEPAEYAAWAESMGATSVPLDPELPCLYVYPGEPKDIESLEECQSLVCDGSAVYNDMVSDSNGNLDLSPILDTGALEALGALEAQTKPEGALWGEGLHRQAFDERPLCAP